MSSVRDVSSNESSVRRRHPFGSAKDRSDDFSGPNGSGGRKENYERISTGGDYGGNRYSRTDRMDYSSSNRSRAYQHHQGYSSSRLSTSPGRDFGRMKRSGSRPRTPDMNGSHESRDPNRYSHYYRNRFGNHSPEEYQNLRMSNLDDNLDDVKLKLLLEKIFERYADTMSVRIVHHENSDFGGNRLAYVNFTRPGDAREARRTIMPRVRKYLGDGVKVDPAGIIVDQSGRLVSNDFNRGGYSGGGSGTRTYPPMRGGGSGVRSNYYSGGSGRDRSRNSLSPDGDDERFYSRRGDNGSDKSRQSQTPIGSKSGAYPPLTRTTDAYSNRGDRGSPERHRLQSTSGHASPNLPDRLEHPNAEATVISSTKITPNRTLFVGNLDPLITVDDLKVKFEKFGVIEDVDVKRGDHHPHGLPYAFIRYQNLDMAEAARQNLSGTTILGYRCKIGFGKPLDSRRLWVGGLGVGSSLQMLEREFDRFGAIERIDFVKGDNHAYILFDNLDAAIEARKRMRNSYLPDSEGREKYPIRVDFAADGEAAGVTGAAAVYTTGKEKIDNVSAGRGSTKENPGVKRTRSPSPSTLRSPPISKQNGNNSVGKEIPRHNRRSPPPLSTGSSAIDTSLPAASKRHKRTRSRSSSPTNGCEGQKNGNATWTPRGEEIVAEDLSSSNATPVVVSRTNGILESDAKSLAELLTVHNSMWSGVLVLKKSAYPVQLVHLKGDLRSVRQFIEDGSGASVQLTVSQRLSLNQPRSDDIPRWTASDDHFFLLAAPTNTTVSVGKAESNLSSSNAQLVTSLPGPLVAVPEGLTPRSLKLLIHYFKEKGAAGVINLTSHLTREQSVLYAFPLCTFAEGLLDQLAPKLKSVMTTSSDDCLLVVIVKGAA